MTKKKDKPLTLTEKYDLAMQYLIYVTAQEKSFYTWLKLKQGLTDDQIKQFERVPF